jgi:hypothetical protein
MLFSQKKTESSVFFQRYENLQKNKKKNIINYVYLLRYDGKRTRKKIL